MQLLGAGVWGLERNPRTRTAFDCGEMALGNGRKEVHGRERLQRNVEQSWTQDAIKKGQ